MPQADFLSPLELEEELSLDELLLEDELLSDDDEDEESELELPDDAVVELAPLEA